MAGGPAVAAEPRRRSASISAVLALVLLSFAGLVGTVPPAAADQASPPTIAPTIARPPTVAAAAQACSLVQVAAGSWLGGAGVAVHSNGISTGTGSSCAGLSTSNPAVQYGYGWQCVELASRLYAVKGWGRVYADGGPAAGAYRYGAQYIPEGSPTLQFRPNGSGYLPVPGDLIIERYSSGWGHVSVIDRTVGKTVYAVEQNANPTGRHSYALTGSTLSGQYSGTVRGFMHAPANRAVGSLGTVSDHDFTGDGRADLLGVTPGGALFLYRGNGVGGFSGAGDRIGAGWGMFATVFMPGDFTGDGRADVLAITPGGALFLYRGNGVGGFSGGGVSLGTGWNTFARVFSPGDYTGDGRADILGITAGGDLFLYRGNGVGGFSGGGTRIGTGWNMFARVFSPGDYTGDGRADILGITAGGDLFLYRGNGVGGFTGGGTRIGTGWNMFARVFSPGDFSGDARADIMAATSGGDLYLYRGNGLGGFAGGGTRIGTGWGLLATLF